MSEFVLETTNFTQIHGKKVQNFWLPLWKRSAFSTMASSKNWLRPCRYISKGNYHFVDNAFVETVSEKLQKKYLGSSKLHSDQKQIMDQRKDT